jgi:hypothetical protein
VPNACERSARCPGRRQPARAAGTWTQPGRRYRARPGTRPGRCRPGRRRAQCGPVLAHERVLTDAEQPGRRRRRDLDACSPRYVGPRKLAIDFWKCSTRVGQGPTWFPRQPCAGLQDRQVRELVPGWRLRHHDHWPRRMRFGANPHLRTGGHSRRAWPDRPVRPARPRAGPAGPEGADHRRVGRRGDPRRTAGQDVRGTDHRRVQHHEPGPAPNACTGRRAGPTQCGRNGPQSREGLEKALRSGTPDPSCRSRAGAIVGRD